MEGHLNYVIKGVERKFFFGNYALEKVLFHFKCTVNEIAQIPDYREVEFLRLYMYHAACYAVYKSGGIPDFTEIDSHDWIDASSYDIILKVREAINQSFGVSNDADSTPEEKKRTLKKSA